jgi:ABC-type bacteriocin/lantibiotic exporter with double-glycine peptidase domain
MSTRKFLIPEVIQTSEMDCGPAALKSVLEGFHIPAHYGRLREACQTDVDGTSIDTLEDIALELGLDAAQTLIPADHLVLPQAQALPALAVVELPSGITHFVVIWRVHGGYAQVMDPAVGRRWVRIDRLMDELYRHEAAVPASDWMEWAQSPEFVDPLSQRMARLGIAAERRAQLLAAAMAGSWRALAALDAAVRMCQSLRQAKAVRRGLEAGTLLDELWRLAQEDPAAIPERYWSARAAPTDDDPEQLLLSGAVLIRFGGMAAGASATESPALRKVLDEPAPRPLHALWGLLGADGMRLLLMIALGSAIVAAGLLVEMLLLRGMLEVGRDLGLVEQRAGAVTALLLFVLALLLVELPIASGLRRIGWQLEMRLRLGLLRKMPRLGDRYFHSRPISDMAERAHSLHSLRNLPEMAEDMLRPSLGLVLTALAIALLDPPSAWTAALAAVAALAVPWLGHAALSEKDMQVRTHEGALVQFYLDSLIGLGALRAHSAQRAIAGEHESLLTQWARASLALQFRVVLVAGVQLGAGFGFAAWILFAHLGRIEDTGTVLLLVYWAVSLPGLGQDLATASRQYPRLRNRLLRLLEPLSTPEETSAEPGDARASASTPPAHGVSVRCEALSVRAAGHTILDEVNLDVGAGEHVAIVGPSGAGKSSLVGVLLGWLTPCSGQLHVDDRELDAAHLAQLRLQTAWVDPAVQLWNRSLLGNLSYGAPQGSTLPFAQVLDTTGLQDLLQRLPEGLQSDLGEGGGLLSGGEGQRVRLARAMLRPGVRLAILDEPFRGLERARRAALLQDCRRLWSAATLFLVTHDIAEAQAFDRVLVVENGRLVEQGTPADLASNPDSRFSAMLKAEAEVRERLWSGPQWTQWRLEGGRLAL